MYNYRNSINLPLTHSPARVPDPIAILAFPRTFQETHTHILHLWSQVKVYPLHKYKSLDMIFIGIRENFLWMVSQRMNEMENTVF